MSGLENEKTIEELFNAIDSFKNSDDENETIIDKVKNEIFIAFSSLFDNQRKKKKIRDRIRIYTEYLLSLNDLITEQLAIINDFFEKPNEEIKADIFINMKKKMMEYSVKAYTLDHEDMFEFCGHNVTSVYYYIQMYDFLERYHEKIKDKYKFKVKQTDQIQPSLTEWKNVFYIIVDMRNQSRFRRNLFLNYITKTRKNIDDNTFFTERSDCYTADFQGRLSKSIFYQRKKLSLTQEELSKRSGVGRTMIAKIERVNQKPTLETAVKLLSALNLELIIYPALEGKQRALLQCDLYNRNERLV